MKKVLKILIPILTILILLAGPQSVLAQPPEQTGTQTISGDQLILGNNYVLKAGQTLNGDLAALGGNVIIESGAAVNGSIALLGGNLDLGGTTSGDVALLGGNITLSKGAVISGQIVSLGGNITGAELATIRGGIRTISPRAFSLDGNAFNQPGQTTTPPVKTFSDIMFGLLTRVMQTLGLAVLAVIVVLVLPHPTKHVADSISNQPWMSLGAGFLTLLAAPFALLILTITIILIPVTILAALSLAAAVIFGWIALGFQIGRRMEVLFKTQWADAVSAGLGTLVLGFAVWVLGFVPCIGWLIGLIAGGIGLGGVALSGFGTRTSALSAPPAAPGASLSESIPPASPSPKAAVEEPKTPPEQPLQ